MSFKKINNITGWIVFAIACTVFVMTREATVSFWDCGEFTPCAYKLQISHAPGAPLFILLGRLFIILFSGSWDATVANAHAAVQVILLSSLSSAFTVLFLFWTITHLAKRMLTTKDEVINMEKTIAIMGAGIVGALAFAFSDSFWFSSEEAIVFGVSPLFIALSVWCIMKWEEQADLPHADRWIILLSYIIGLSIGVHLLSILGIPAIVMTYYFRRYKFSRKGMILAFLLACVLTGVVQVIVIQDTVKIMGWFELMFVNDFGMPFNTGCFFFIILLLGIAIFGIRWAIRNKRRYLEMGLYSLIFILLGYSSYAVILIRANAGVSVNMQNVNSPIELVAYLDRSQYGEWPILSGAYFTAKPTGTTEKGNIYYKDESTGRYEVVGKKIGYTYDDGDTHLFPRMWDTDNSQGHVDYYKSFSNLADGESPTVGDNIHWLVQYQFMWMYWRYFMWNFSGRQNDLQGYGNVRDGNWITGIPFYDNWRLGDQSKMPDSLKHNAAHTTLFLLPLLLGVLGLVFQWKKDKTNAIVVGLLYFFTGIAIILYLNQAGPQPRERDYSYVGSFYAFAIWIGLGVLFVYDQFKRKLNGTTSGVLAALVCVLAVPFLMCCQEWKAHDRSQKTLARDAASDYLNSCAPNAILFTGGDNDTYPLWYAQEVENVRPDVRVIVTSLLGTDWMINQLRNKVNESDPIPMSWTADKTLGDNRNYVPIEETGKVPKGQYMDLNAAMAFIGDDRNQLQTQGGENLNYAPTHNFFMPVDKQAVLANGTVPLVDSARVAPQMAFTVPGNALLKNDLMELNIIAANNWKRPVYFTQPYGLGLNGYIQNDGLAYRLAPIKPSSADFAPVQADTMFRNLMERFKFGGADKANVYFDENGRRILLSIRGSFASLGQVLAIKGTKEGKDSALKVLDYGYEKLNPTTLGYGETSAENRHDIVSLQFAYGYFLAGDSAKATKITDALVRDCRQQIDFYNSLNEDEAAAFQQDLQTAKALIGQVENLKQRFAAPLPSVEKPGVIDTQKTK